MHYFTEMAFDPEVLREKLKAIPSEAPLRNAILDLVRIRGIMPLSADSDINGFGISVVCYGGIAYEGVYCLFEDLCEWIESFSALDLSCLTFTLNHKVIHGIRTPITSVAYHSNELDEHEGECPLTVDEWSNLIVRLLGFDN